MMKWTMIFFFNLVSMTRFDAAMAVCPVTISEIRSRSGTLKHVEQNRLPSNRWCGWSISDETLDDHVILLTLTSLSLKRDRDGKCNGELSLTGHPLFCRRAVPSCFLYASNRSCQHLITSDLLKRENCTNLYFQLEKRSVWRIRYRTKAAPGTKSFSFDYKFISCGQDLKPQKPKVNSIPSESANVTSYESFITSPNGTAELVSQIHSGVSTGTLAGVIAFFIVLLAATIALLLLLYRRCPPNQSDNDRQWLRKLKLQAHSPARVQYELAKAKDITVLQSSNTEQTNDSPSRESTFSLHGEHNATNSRNDETITHEEPVERKYSDIEDLILSDAATPTFPTLPVQRRQPDPEDETCVYATVNKRRATIER